MSLWIFSLVAESGLYIFLTPSAANPQKSQL